MRAVHVGTFLALAYLAGACGRTGLAPEPEAHLTVEPVALTFRPVEPGRSDMQVLALRSVGPGTLTVTDFRLPDASFTADLPLQSLPLELAPRESLEVPIWYSSVTGDGAEGWIEIVSNDADDLLLHSQGVRWVRLGAPNAEPILSVFPFLIDFGNVSAGDYQVRSVTISNAGTRDLFVDAVSLDAGEEFAVLTALDAHLGATHPLAPGEGFDVEIGYAPVADGPDAGVLRVWSNDGGSEATEIPVMANGSAPCLAVSGEGGFDFGPTAIGSTREQAFVIRNCSTSRHGATLVVSEIELEEEESARSFRVDDSVRLPIELAPGERSSFVLAYSPTEVTREWGAVRVRSNDPYKPDLRIELRGSGTGNSCPVAAPRCSLRDRSAGEGEELAAWPLATIACRGDESWDADGEVVRFHWSVIERPAGSSAQFAATDAAATSLFLDLAGLYRLRLEVTDDAGQPSCAEPAELIVQATPVEDLHVQLVWTTPLDSNPDGTGPLEGTDVDLHLLHPNGDWEDRRWDCHFRNQFPDWGNPGSRTDDPRLDIDDTSGRGPENINLSHPETGVTYTVGVHYWNENGFGSTFATVRIYIFGVLQFVADGRELPHESSFWEVATIAWPSATISRIDRITAGFP